MLYINLSSVNDSSINSDQIIVRKAVKAIVYKNEKILLIKSSLGDYKFPGGGTKHNETEDETLSREILEETGFTLKSKHELLFKVKECRKDKYIIDKYFLMKSNYYLCEIEETSHPLHLDDYEKELNLTVEWQSPEKAFLINKKIIENGKYNEWTLRETKVLQTLINI